MAHSPFHGIFSASFNPEVGMEPATPPPAQQGRSQPVVQTAGSASAQRVGQVALDIFEFESYYIIKAPIAGVRMSDLDIEITDNVLTIRGTRRQTDSIPEDQYYLQECFWGEFSRSVTLPCSIDPKKVKATFNKECILKILVPKEEKVKIVRIND